jgi:alpha-tubulin suppressor-like RCC1 family protein
MPALPLGRLSAAWLLAGTALIASGCSEDTSSPSGPESAPALAAAAALSFRQVSAGTDFSCGLTTGGLAYCWGGGKTKPTAVPGGRRFVQISSGDRHSCAVTSENRAYCWGRNGWGQLGDGSTTDRSTPVLVPGRFFRQIRAGYLHTCAITTTDAAFCWGNNDFGQLGTGGAQTLTPARVARGLLWSRVVAGASHTCGVTKDNRGYCWGANFFGQLGDGSKTHRSKPALIAGGRTFRQVVPGGGWFPDFVEPFVDDGHSCALTTDNKAYCWGSNESGVLGSGTPANSVTPVKVAGDRSYQILNTGVTHTCAVNFSSVAFCWGNNSEGQLGVGSGTGSSLSPVRVAGGIAFSSVNVGILGNHSCGWTSSGTAYCWGRNGSGQLGDGTTTQRSTPVAVIGPI